MFGIKYGIYVVCSKLQPSQHNHTAQQSRQYMSRRKLAITRTGSIRGEQHPDGIIRLRRRHKTITELAKGHGHQTGPTLSRVERRKPAAGTPAGDTRIGGRRWVSMGGEL
jgi:hypothetical protein